MHTVELWRWRFTYPVTGRAYRTRHVMTQEDALALDPGALACGRHPRTSAGAGCTRCQEALASEHAHAGPKVGVPLLGLLACLHRVLRVMYLVTTVRALGAVVSAQPGHEKARTRRAWLEAPGAYRVLPSACSRMASTTSAASPAGMG